ncbi:MAG TPA: CidA/LrgA family protein [Gammaproteobacteria bacterium]|nr:CidA/LrgA family protein [Gammaproteobacteria bacterium]HPQ26125.1 CidA/LrgA family protein [Gammaproteobacteria bacterium]
MQFLNGITLLLIFQLIGEFGARLLDIPVPGPVVGMLLLFLTLIARRSVAPSLETASGALLGHLSLLFVPAGVGMMIHFDRIAGEWLPIAVALLGSTVITMLASALIMAGTSRLFAPGDRQDD